jgi:hypothetical protein
VTAPAQPAGTDFQLEVITEVDPFLHSDWLGSHKNTPGEGLDSTPAMKQGVKCKLILELSPTQRLTPRHTIRYGR